MKTKTLKATLSVFVAFSLALSSCDTKNASLVNRRTATPEKEEEIKEAQRAKEIADVSPLIKRLYAMGRPDAEIRGFMQLEKENEYLDNPLGEILYFPMHFVYRVNGKNYDGAQTGNSCGIWAVRRKLRHMHYLGNYGIPADAWYSKSDMEMRQIIESVSGERAKEGEMLYDTDIVRLQTEFGINEDNAEVHGINCKVSGIFFKELFYVYNQQESEDDPDLAESYHKGGNIHGFDYDNWGPTTVSWCRVYYKR
ncbi:hypothetical protein AGMMS50222_00760 [Endomicrobiia bacterium]|nr:hypothetical protein AGMMS50222_00760 [Endomicrobiia bacterium]